jgi:hypothetical protein
MTAGWIPLSVWLMLGALLVIAGVVEWAFRHKRYLELLHQAPIPGGDQANFRVIVGDHPLIENSSSRIIGDSQVHSGTLTGDDELDGWEKLYEEYDREKWKCLSLIFLPDSDDQASDALLLLCYGYKIIKNVESISAKFVNSQIEYLLQHAPNTRESPIYRFGNAMAFTLSERDFGKKCVSQGNVERIGLSHGGFYRLTSWGEEKARDLARDLIRRA